MTREIKSRGKATQDYETSLDGIQKGDWVEGYYYYCRERESGIIVTCLAAESGGVGSGIVQVEIEVDYKTVGQFVGLKDENGKEIYEGDIVKGVDEHKGQSEVFIGDVFELQPFSYLNDYEGNNFEVIGNIYQDKHLLK